jgi:hypothetical protein
VQVRTTDDQGASLAQSPDWFGISLGNVTLINESPCIVAPSGLVHVCLDCQDGALQREARRAPVQRTRVLYNCTIHFDERIDNGIEFVYATQVGRGDLFNAHFSQADCLQLLR